MIKIEVIKETIENINGTIAADLQLKVLPGTSNMKSLISAYRSCLETKLRFCLSRLSPPVLNLLCFRQSTLYIKAF